ncbi:MAG TPA: radical SAM protein [Reyranella sp.]|nr:radical SAM protein [Reyranella sp.]
MSNSVAAEARVFRSASGSHLLIVDGSRVYDLPAAAASEIERDLAPGADGAVARALLGDLMDGSRPRYIDDAPLQPPPIFSLSLNVAQTCNMSCGYCYADSGKFGGTARLMPFDVAVASVDRLIAQSPPGADLVLGFMGGEPLVNRKLVHSITGYAADAARRAGRRMRFSLTTNATLLEPEDARLFIDHRFQVAVSLDGDRMANDAVRPMRDGSGSYGRIVAGIELLQRDGRPAHLSARATVTPRTGELLPILDHLVGLGFDSAGFAAVLTSPDPALAFGEQDFGAFRRHMIDCGRKTLEALLDGRSYPFSNFETALHEIHRGTHRPYPCGAGAGYLSVNAKGNLYACHRLLDDDKWAMGDVFSGPDDGRRAQHLSQSHVDRMEPCRSCWARYLCGGGCYHEVQRRGRIGCDYIRGWLEFCLGAYVELSAARPEYFDRSRRERAMIEIEPARTEG